MYAVTNNSYRSIKSEKDLLDGEVFSIEIPSSLIDNILVLKMKSERNLKLSLSDWTQLPGCPLTIEEVKRYEDYRKELRDLPDRDGFPNCDWPVHP